MNVGGVFGPLWRCKFEIRHPKSEVAHCTVRPFRNPKSGTPWVFRNGLGPSSCSQLSVVAWCVVCSQRSVASRHVVGPLTFHVLRFHSALRI